MSTSQKVLKIFGILEIVSAVAGAITAFSSGNLVTWANVVVSLCAAYLLLAAAKDASKVNGAWTILLVELILSAAELFLSMGDGGAVVIGGAIAVCINLIAFIAANNVKKQANL